MNALLSVKTKNAIKRVAAEKGLSCIVFALWRNDIINGQKVGCTGFVTNPDTGKVIFISTGDARFLPDWINGHLYREAKCFGDYGGSHSNNKFSEGYEATALAEAVVKELLSDKLQFPADDSKRCSAE